VKPFREFIGYILLRASLGLGRWICVVIIATAGTAHAHSYTAVKAAGVAAGTEMVAGTNSGQNDAGDMFAGETCHCCSTTGLPTVFERVFHERLPYSIPSSTALSLTSVALRILGHPPKLAAA